MGKVRASDGWKNQEIFQEQREKVEGWGVEEGSGEGRWAARGQGRCVWGRGIAAKARGHAIALSCVC